MTAQVHGSMAAHQRMAVLSGLLPDADAARRRPAWAARLAALVPFRRRLRGLEGIPERYRLQFLLLCDAAMPGAAEAGVKAMADRLADRTRPPKRLVAKLPDHDDLDRWFRGHSDEIKATLDGLLEAETR